MIVSSCNVAGCHSCAHCCNCNCCPTCGKCRVCGAVAWRGTRRVSVPSVFSPNTWEPTWTNSGGTNENSTFTVTNVQVTDENSQS
jgi:hypothetical protein